MSTGLGPIWITNGSATAAVHALAADHEDQVRLQAGDLLEVFETGYMPQ